MSDRPATDWEARFQASREPLVKVLDTSFAGIPAGARMLVVTPRIVDALVSEIAPGAVMAAATLRQRLAARHGAAILHDGARTGPFSTLSHGRR
ncbi:hypothetical protein [Synechococcus sp. BA-132 BA5]|uniref:hypothetical protein n=1 Tax=Synechococcus sp. BA-132 BA5 TaxID=3110252 RepID=UPI002B20B129|nr:hypothetical protein [Synechococcus sp. BA-132 BA5]MEA5416399.1 hypothetical protein [Synechococcus sp. BA-132 BA5]